MSRTTARTTAANKFICKHIQTWTWHTGKSYTALLDELKNNANQAAFSKRTSENINAQNLIILKKHIQS